MAKKSASKKKCCPCPKKTMRKTRKTRRTTKATKTRKSRGKNEFFSLMLKAKKTNAPSFTYKGKTYKRTTTKNGLIFYKKA
jgi:hypothetical protein